MPSYSRSEVVLVRYPFTDLTGSKVRPAVVVSASHPSEDVFVVPLTSRTTALLAGEFLLGHWQSAGLRVATAAKRGVYTIQRDLIIKSVGRLADPDAQQLDQSLRAWLGLS